MMDAQPQLFAPSPNGRLAPALPPHNFTRTSIDAARKVSRKVKGERERILALLAEPPWNRTGATQQEISDALRLDRSNVSGRCNGLWEDGKIVIFGKRKTRANVAAHVYFLSESERAS